MDKILSSKWETSKKSEPLKSKWDTPDEPTETIPVELPSKWATVHKSERLQSKWADDDDDDDIPLSPKKGSRSKKDTNKAHRNKGHDHGVDTKRKPKDDTAKQRKKEFEDHRSPVVNDIEVENKDTLKMTDAGRELAMRLGIKVDNEPSQKKDTSRDSRSTPPRSKDGHKHDVAQERRHRDNISRQNQGQRYDRNRPRDLKEKGQDRQHGNSRSVQKNHVRSHHEGRRAANRGMSNRHVDVGDLSERLGAVKIDEEARKKEEEARKYLESLESNLDWAEFDD
jgi:hypothetical protein